MRLQLAIYRHTLPPTHILFSTAPHPSAYTSARDATISDLIHDVNDLVPLESENGAWGLEDYVVEVAATADQDKVYEALHFQTIENSLREDDEVVIRYLKSDELKSRRWCGRWQITGDGAHLIDGVVWGRRWDHATRAGARPAVGIPPRKKRGGLRVEGQREIVPEDPLLAVMGVDDHDDEDYVDEAIDEVKISSTFDDIDGDNDNDDSDLDDMDDDEAQLLLKDAEELHNSDPTLPEALPKRQLRARETTQQTSLGKRKRSVEDEGGEDSEFEGFSTPAKIPARRQVQFEDEIDSESDSIMAGATVVQATNVDASHVADEDEDEDKSSETEYSSDSGTSSSTSSDSDDESMISDASDSSVSGSSSADSDSLHSSQEPLSESETSSSSDSYSDSEQQTPRSNAVNIAFENHVSPKPNTAVAADQQTAKMLYVAPGQGKLATRRKNERVKKVKLLNSLKHEGLLAANANFEDLRAYQEGLGPSQGLPASTDPELEAARLRALGIIQESTSLKETQVSAGGQGDGIVNLEGPQDPESVQSMVIGETPHPTELPGTTEFPPQPPPGSSEKRSRLDVAASRRLLFGSLGVKNPKTAEEEQQLREKLAKPVRAKQVDKPAEPRTSPRTENVNDLNTNDGWENKLIVFAVECDKEGMKMTPPPFPFQQHWMKKSMSLKSQEQELDYGEAAYSKPLQQPDLRFQDVPNTDERLKLKKLSASLPNFAVRECYEALRLSNWAYDAAVDHLFNAEASQSQEAHAQNQSQDTQRPEDPSDNGSRTVSFAKDDADGMPIPTNFETLTDLEQAHLLPRAVIAYKELCMGEETNFQPGISSYRVGRVSALDTDGYVTFTLAIKDRKKPTARDPETGKAIANNFEVRTSEDNDEVDDGVREMEFTQMITPKLVEVGVQVPDSSIVSNMRGRDAAKVSPHESTEIVPDSAPTAHRGIHHPTGNLEEVTIDIDTPRRQEIVTLIKEAGFDSVVGEQLLEPLSSKATDNADDAQFLEDQAASSLDLDLVQQPAIAETSQPRTNSWPLGALFTHENPTSPGLDDTDIPLTNNDELESSPPVSPQLTVDYPHISQMELDSSFHVPVDSSKNSSSYQDAQRVPAVPTVDIPLANVEEHEESFQADNDDVQLGDEALDELRSEVSQSQSQSQEASNLQLLSELSELHDSDAPAPPIGSFLGIRGADGAGSSPDAHRNDDDDGIEEGNKPSDDSLFSDEEVDSDDSLPSLAELTSSQRRKIGSKKTTSKTKLSISKKLLSPPKSRANRNLRSHDTNGEGKELRKKTPSPSFNFDGADDLPPSSQPEPESSLDPLQTPVKIAMSQQEKRMSQIPLGTQVVDLTLSSDPVSPSGSDGEYRCRSRQGNSRGRKANGANGTRKAKGKGSKLGASVSDLGGGAGTEVGIGTRRFLTAKKSRSQI